jgi:hypothetical protein
MAFKSILDRTFKYRNAISTDVRHTFERVKREQRLQQTSGEANGNHTAKVVVTIGHGRSP